MCYDMAKAPKLSEAVRTGDLEPHPVSGEVEVDWKYEVDTRYRRVDEETLQAFVVLSALNLAFQLVWCVNDELGGADGWRVGEITVPSKTSPFAKFGGCATVPEAELRFINTLASSRRTTPRSGLSHHIPSANIEEEEDDDSYWEQYDDTPAQSRKSSLVPRARKASIIPGSNLQDISDDEDEGDYYAQYDGVQPAMDNHDPDEAQNDSSAAPPLGLAAALNSVAADPTPSQTTQKGWSPRSDSADKAHADEVRRIASLMHHPRPESSASSSRGSETVAKLEASVERQENNEFGVKQHVSRSIRSLFLLSQAAGIDRGEFEQMIQTELDVLSMMENS